MSRLPYTVHPTYWRYINKKRKNYYIRRLDEINRKCHRIFCNIIRSAICDTAYVLNTYLIG